MAPRCRGVGPHFWAIGGIQHCKLLFVLEAGPDVERIGRCEEQGCTWGVVDIHGEAPPGKGLTHTVFLAPDNSAQSSFSWGN